MNLEFAVSSLLFRALKAILIFFSIACFVHIIRSAQFCIRISCHSHRENLCPRLFHPITSGQVLFTSVLTTDKTVTWTIRYHDALFDCVQSMDVFLFTSLLLLYSIEWFTSHSSDFLSSLMVFSVGYPSVSDDKCCKSIVHSSCVICIQISLIFRR